MTNATIIPSKTIPSKTTQSKTVAKKTWQTPGGVHPPENKQQSMQLPLAELAIPKELIFPVSQHLGVPAEPIVNVGDKVLAGQKIAEAVGVMSVPVHASTSGKIIAIEDRILPHTSGMSGRCIVLESDQQHCTIHYQGIENYQAESPSTLINTIRDAGIAGMGGAGFPSAIKLSPRSDVSIDTLILNGTECEPYITADDRIMQDFADDIIQGALLLHFILGEPKRIIIGIEDNKPDAINAMQSAVNRTAQSELIDIVSFPTKYPSGGEKQLIQILTGKEVPSGKIPSSLGIVVQNVGTAMAAYRAVVHGEPLTWRATTVVGEALQTQRNVKVLLGTPVAHLLSENGLATEDIVNNTSRLIMGGPMMGFTLPSAEVPVVKTTNCIIAPTKSEMPNPPPAQACIRCGLCAEACPAQLLPQQLYWYARAEDNEKLQNHNLFDCIECGACSYVCPSTIPLVQYYRAAKGTIREQEHEKTKSDHARQRFEFRKERMEQAEREKEEKRKERKLAAEKAKKIAAEKKAAAAKNETDNAISSESTTAAASTALNSTEQKDKAVESIDPVAAAMARVQSAQQDPELQKSKLERTVASAQARVDKLLERIKLSEEDESQSDQKEKMAAQLKQAEVRLLDAQQKLTGFLTTYKNTADNESVSTDSAAKKLAAAPSVAVDAATAAIERAKAKSEAMANMSPEDKLKAQLESLSTRLEKARAKLQKAETEGSEHIDALRNGLAKMEAKFAATQQELNNLEST